MAIDDQMEYERQLYIKKEMDKEGGRRERMMEQKSVLQKQILDRQVLAVEAREEADRDKEMVEAIVNKINEQDRLEIEERNRKKEEVRRGKGGGEEGRGGRVEKRRGQTAEPSDQLHSSWRFAHHDSNPPTQNSS